MWTPPRQRESKAAREQSARDRAAELREQTYRRYREFRMKGLPCGAIVNAYVVDVDTAFQFEARYLQERASC